MITSAPVIERKNPSLATATPEGPAAPAAGPIATAPALVIPFDQSGAARSVAATGTATHDPRFVVAQARPTRVAQDPDREYLRQRLRALGAIDQTASYLIQEIARARRSAKNARFGETVHGIGGIFDALSGRKKDGLDLLLDGISTGAAHSMTNRAKRDIEQVQRRAMELTALLQTEAPYLGEVMRTPDGVRGSGIRLGTILLRNTSDTGLNSVVSAFEAANSFSHASDLGRAVRQLEQLERDIGTLRSSVARMRESTVRELRSR